MPDALLLAAAFQLRDLATLEFLYDLHSEEGMFLSQLALDLRKIAYGDSPRDTAMFRAVAEQFPRLFVKGDRLATHICTINL